MTDTVQVRLHADTPRDLAAAQARLGSAFALAEFSAPRAGRQQGWFVYGTLQLYDTQATLTAKLARFRHVIEKVHSDD